ncbi:YdcF family protein [Histidinibacterium lentulum]|uniref:YdcF family protein n=1 Tax=Histidinibacterium lentulum TaxID=2480588 RepID=UPI001FE31C58|nr:YdcF family protein [Histidinibacterium lentulum]
MFWTLARPESWIVLLLVAALLAFRRNRPRLGQRTLLTSLLLLLGIGILPLGELLIRPLEQRFPARPEVVDPAGIIILGGAEDARTTEATGLPEVNEAGDRFLAGLALARAHPGARLIFTGGSGSLLDQGVSGADAAERLFAEAGVAPERVLLEGASRNTAENAALTRELVGAAEGPWVLVTSAFHMPRSVATFCAAGWRDVVPYPVDYRGAGNLPFGWDLAERLRTLNTVVKEWIGLVAYRLTGRTEALVPDGC